jgi:hypothetical protein
MAMELGANSVRFVLLLAATVNIVKVTLKGLP